MRCDRAGILLACVLAPCLGCSGDERPIEVEPVPPPTIRPDPSYKPALGDDAALLRPTDPRGRVPFIHDLEVYHRAYEDLKQGGDDLGIDESVIGWASAGSPVKVLNVVTADMADSFNRLEVGPTQEPWAKIELTGPDGAGIGIKDRIGFVPVEFVVRPLP